jgi:hypothetical protein
VRLAATELLTSRVDDRHSMNIFRTSALQASSLSMPASYLNTIVVRLGLIEWKNKCRDAKENWVTECVKMWYIELVYTILAPMKYNVPHIKNKCTLILTSDHSAPPTNPTRDPCSRTKIQWCRNARHRNYVGITGICCTSPE